MAKPIPQASATRRGCGKLEKVVCGGAVAQLGARLDGIEEVEPHRLHQFSPNFSLNLCFFVILSDDYQFLRQRVRLPVGD